MDDMVKKAHVIDNSHIRCVLVDLDKILHKGFI